ncbi:MAG: hypothetical protein ACOZIN_12530 [Myxococcota bacterium]
MSPVRRGLVLLVVLASAGAWAYILPAFSILRRMVERRADLQLSTLKVGGSLAFFGEAAKEAGAALGVATDRSEVSVDGAVYLKVPGRCRFEAASVEAGKKSAAAQAASKRRSEGAEIRALAVAVEQLCPLLALRSTNEADARAAIERHLGALKADTKKTSLARFGGRVAYVLGGRDDPGQLWVYKDSFLPARIRLTDETGVAWDVRLLDYSSPATGEWFPRVIEIFKNGAPALRFTGLDGNVKGKLDDALF